MKKSILLLSATILVLIGVLCSCGKMTLKQAVQITLYADFSAGSAEAESLDLITSKKQTASGILTVEVLAKRLSEWTGLDFKINRTEVSKDSVTVDWSANSTLVAGLDDREQKEEFQFFDVENLNWFMMDSLARTIKENLKISTVYYSMDGGKPIVLEDMTGLDELSVEQPYEGSAFFFAQTDNKGDDETGHFTYKDEKNQIILAYPNVFSAKGVMDNSGHTLRFTAQQGDSSLLYWVIPNTYEDNTTTFIEGITAEKSQELEGNVVIAKMNDIDQKTGKVTPCAYFWVVDIDRIVIVSIQCTSSEEASQWYDSLEGGAVYIESLAGEIDADDGMSENEAIDLLDRMLSNQRKMEGTAIVAKGESKLYGQHCWTFSFGKNTADKFTAEEHFAVTDNGKIYIMDIIKNRYVPFTVG